MESRPRYQKLLEAARKCELDVVLVWRYDRFARSTRALVNALGEFKARGVAFIRSLRFRCGPWRRPIRVAGGQPCPTMALD